jgi:hypothetical protein
MPLLDHFHPPLHPNRHWEGFHAFWASAIAGALNETLPPGEYFAEPLTHMGARVEIDVATFESKNPDRAARRNGPAATAVAPAIWTPPAATMTMPTVFPDTFEVRIFSTMDGGANLVAAIDLVSPSNKDRPEERRGFAIKAASYLCQGISLIVVDIVTSRQANLHNEMVGLLHGDATYRLADVLSLYAVAYQPVLREEKPQLDMWPALLSVGGTLPVLPLALRAGLVMPVDFEATYSDACRRLRLI